MSAEIIVGHDPSRPDAEVELLVEVFDENDSTALQNSNHFTAATWKDRIIFARELTSYRILCLRDGNNELMCYIEVMHGTILEACRSAWKKLKQALTVYAQTSKRPAD